jgi:hypothetical protein
VAATVYEYYTWTGRWAASGLSYFLTSSFDLVNGYGFLLLISPTLLAISVYAVLQTAAIGESIRQRLALTACFVALYWAGMPHPGETFYWLTGSSDNLAGLAPRRKVTSWVTGGGLCVIAVIAAGFHELFALVLCILLAGSTLVLWRVNDGRRWLCMCCLFAACAGFFVVYSAPGNRVRRAEFTLASDPSTTLRLTVKQGLYNVIPWALDVRLLSATALVLILVPAALTAAPNRRKVNGREIAILAATWLCAIGAAFAAASWAIGMEIPARTLNGLYLFFCSAGSGCWCC